MLKVIKMNKFYRKWILCILSMMFLLLTPIQAFSMDTAFINKPEIWYERQNIVHFPEQTLGKYKGSYGYYIDAENHCFYLHISYVEMTLTDSDNEIKLQFQIANMN